MLEGRRRIDARNAHARKLEFRRWQKTRPQWHCSLQRTRPGSARFRKSRAEIHWQGRPAHVRPDQRGLCELSPGPEWDHLVEFFCRTKTLGGHPMNEYWNSLRPMEKRL